VVDFEKTRHRVDGDTGLSDTELRLAEAALHDLEEQFEAWPDLANWMWTIICNVNEGDWTKQNQEWQDAAALCRDQYHALLDKGPKLTESPFPQPPLESVEKSLWPDREIPGKPADTYPAKRPSDA
jgi:hypothetical protein